MSKDSKSFAFLALAYNHEQFIVEHLESIKYLVETHGQGTRCELIINDDCSKDKTVYLIEKWLEVNGFLFDRVVKLFNKKNIGTCASIVNMLENVKADNLKLTACDDVYSYENIFKYSLLEDNISIRSGVPLSLIDGQLFENKVDTINIIASDIIYKDKPLITRFKLLSNNNAPNIIYNKKYLMNENVIDFLKGFDVVEDWPIQIAIAENYPETSFDLVNKVFVYYRRTSGSAYIVAKGRLFDDNTNIYDHLIRNEKSLFKRKLLENRLFLYKLGNKIANKILNISFFVYFYSIVVRIHNVYFSCISSNLQVNSHKEHYDLIQNNAHEITEAIDRL